MRIVRSGIISLSVGLVFLALLLGLVFDTQVRYPVAGDFDSAGSRVAAQLIERISKRMINAKTTITLQATRQELNQVFVLAHRAHEGVQGKVEVTHEGASFALSLRKHILGLPVYLNLRGTAVAAQGPLQIDGGKIGALPLPDVLTRIIFRKMAATLVGKEYSQELLQSLVNLHTESGNLHWDFVPPPNFAAGIAPAFARLSRLTGHQVALDGERVDVYLRVLNHFDQSTKGAKSLATLLELLFQHALTESQSANMRPDQENLAALYALAIYQAPHIFRHFVSGLEALPETPAKPVRLTLMKREDLAKHFVFSSAIHILAKRGLSLSIAEIKELTDAGNGGTGFSFLDLAADQSGIRLVDLATGREEHARLIQEYSTRGIIESDFFPDVAHFPEGLSEKEFRRIFSDTESDAYRQMLDKIHQSMQDSTLLSLGN